MRSTKLHRHVVRSLVSAWLAAALSACTENAAPPQLMISNADVGGSIVRFNAASTQLALGDWRGDIALWNLPGGTPIRRWHAHAGTVYGLAYLDRDRRILSGGYDGTLAEWDRQGRLLRRVRAGSAITAMAISTVDNIALTGHADGSVMRWQLDSLQAQQRYPVHHGAVRAVAYLPGRHWFASSGTDTRVFLWRATPQSERATRAALALASPPTDSRALQFSPDGRWLIGSGWFRLFRWDLHDLSLATLPTAHHGIIASLQYSADGRYVASISRKTDSSVYFLDPLNGQVLRRFAGHDLCGSWVALSPDQRYLASTSDDATVRVWRLDGSSQRNPGTHAP